MKIAISKSLKRLVAEKLIAKRKEKRVSFLPIFACLGLFLIEKRNKMVILLQPSHLHISAIIVYLLMPGILKVVSLNPNKVYIFFIQLKVLSLNILSDF